MRMRDEDGHQALLAAGKAWKDIKKSSKRLWSHWTTIIGPALVKARAEAMALALTNKPQGRGYNTKMGELLAEYGLDDMSATARADILKIMEKLSEVEAWRAMQSDIERLNHPTNVWKAFSSFKLSQKRLALNLAEDDEGDKEQERNEPQDPCASFRDKIEQLQERIRQLEAEIADLRTQLLIAQARAGDPIL